jgi:hypothetical protein
MAARVSTHVYVVMNFPCESDGLASREPYGHCTWSGCFLLGN